MRRIDWAGLMRLGLVELRLAPEVFWTLTPAELLLIAGAGPVARPLTGPGSRRCWRAFPTGRRSRRRGSDEWPTMTTTWRGSRPQFAGLDGTLSGLGGVTGAFRRELEGVQGSMKEAGREATGMSRSVTSSIRRAFEGVLLDGKSVGDALAGVGKSISGAVLNQAMAPVQGAVGSGLQSLLSGILPFARGAAFGAGRVAAFARGGVVDGPTQFPMRGGVGLMGEAGPEAIMPLARGADGRLGVRAGAGGGPVSVTMNITTPDVDGFRRSQSQVAAEMSRAIGRGRRNL